MRLFETIRSWWRGTHRVKGHAVTPLWVVPMLSESAEDDPTKRSDWQELSQYLQKEERNERP